MTITFIVNSNHLSVRKFESSYLKGIASSLRSQINVVGTEYGGHASDIAEEASNAGNEVVIGVGGDGTLHEVINGLMKNDFEGISGLLPVGSGNDFARNFPSGEDLVTQLHNPTPTELDVGKMTFPDGSVRYFINAASVGLGYDVLKRMENTSLKRFPRLSYYSSIVQVLRRYKSKPIRIQGPDFTWEGDTFIAVVANGRFMGSGLGLAYDALPGDGEFSIVVIGDVTVLHFLRYLSAIKKAKRLEIPQVHYFSGNDIRIESPGDPGAESDGEILPSLPSRIECLPGRIKFII